MGTPTDRFPTPRPATNLPIIMWTQLVNESEPCNQMMSATSPAYLFMAVIWMMFPIMKMETPKDMDLRRPHQSAV